ncbi:MAG: hypothetical protein A2W33_08680 [Chloroflexi bacterium RBG_16_52_11]|nr:MAG: hypothetical protein A2W33_08680 [Chloroflexi bacterium RBG_16_52_11]
MRSLWGKAPFQFQVRDLPTPGPDPGEVLVQVTACGIIHPDGNADYVRLRPAQLDKMEEKIDRVIRGDK